MFELLLHNEFSTASILDYLKIDTKKRENLLSSQFFPQRALRSRELNGTYRIIHNPPSSNSVLLMANNEPVLLIEIHRPAKIGMDFYYTPEENDCCLIIFVSKSIKKNVELQHSSLMAFMDAIFEQTNVLRILVPVFASNNPDILEPLLARAGFSSLERKQINDPQLFIFSKTGDHKGS